MMKAYLKFKPMFFPTIIFQLRIALCHQRISLHCCILNTHKNKQTKQKIHFNTFQKISPSIDLKN